jgi:anti-sigma factor RsiW
MDCGEVRIHLSDLRRHRLAPAQRDEVERHLQGCPACRRALAADEALDELLARSLPHPAAPRALRDRLSAPGTAPTRPQLGRWRHLVAPALAAGLALALGGLLLERHAGEVAQAEALLTGELVNDHLRVLASARPAEIESGGVHQVKPWFEGRLDFAPVVPEPSTPELMLRGGAVGYVFDRRAAVLEYTLRLHRLTLLVVRAGGLPWPDGAARATRLRGFQVVRWRAGELGYALVSDVNEHDLAAVAASFQAATGEGDGLPPAGGR